MSSIHHTEKETGENGPALPRAASVVVVPLRLPAEIGAALRNLAVYRQTTPARLASQVIEDFVKANQGAAE